MRPLMYLLDDNGDPVPTLDIVEFARFMGDLEKRCLARSQVVNLVVWTIFIGFGYEPMDDTPPVFWETLVEEDGHWRSYRRWLSRDEANQGHDHLVDVLRVELAGELH